MNHPPLNERGRMLFENAMRVLPGLLASGHFSTGEGDVPDLLRNDMGQDYHDSFMRRFNTYAIETAIELVQDLEEECWLDTSDPAEREQFFDERMKLKAERDKKAAEWRASQAALKAALP